MTRTMLALVCLALGTDSVRSHAVTTITRGSFANGARMYERAFVNGREEGVHRGWYENGSPRFEYHYHAGLMHGVAREWTRDGHLLSEFNYVAGHEAGQQRMWNTDGTIRSNYVIRNGVRFGLIGAMGCTGENDTTSVPRAAISRDGRSPQ